MKPFFTLEEIDSLYEQSRSGCGPGYVQMKLNSKVAPLLEENERLRSSHTQNEVLLASHRELNEKLTQQVKEDKCPYCEEIVIQNARIAQLEEALKDAAENLRVAYCRFRALTWGGVVTPEHPERVKEIEDAYLKARAALEKK